jgi:hypothetical protein
MSKRLDPTRRRRRRAAWPVAGLLGALALAAGVANAASAAAPQNTTPPRVTGTPQVGQTLSTDNGTWAGGPTSYSYAWLRCDASGANCIAEASTAKTYTVMHVDRGHTIRSKVTATNVDGGTAAQSAQTAVVTANPAAPANTGAPTISGTAQQGQTLTANVGSWTNSPTSYTFRWQRCNIDTLYGCINVPAATAKTYTVQANDLGYRLRVEVTGRNAAGRDTATSTPTRVVIPKTRIVNQHPTLNILGVTFIGQAVYVRFRVCDDSNKNLTISATDSRPGKASYTRRFTTLTAPRPCGVYTRHWTPVARFRGRGRFTITLVARDKSRRQSLPAKRTFSHG